jgi:hypothetical protein
VTARFGQGSGGPIEDQELVVGTRLVQQVVPASLPGRLT